MSNVAKKQSSTKSTKSSTTKPKLAAAPKVETDFAASCAQSSDDALRERTPRAVGTALAFFAGWAADMKRRGLGELDHDEGPMPYNVAERVWADRIALALSMGEGSLAAGLPAFLSEALSGVAYREEEDAPHTVAYLCTLQHLAAVAAETADANHRELQRYRNKASEAAEIAVAAHVAKVRAQGGAS